MIEEHLKLKPGQTGLTLEQQAEAQRFAAERIAAQLSTAPVDEQEAEAFLRQAYQVAGLASLQRIQWVDGPLPLVAVLASHGVQGSLGASLHDSLEAGLEASFEASLGDSVHDSLWATVYERVYERVRDSVWHGVMNSIRDSVRVSLGVSRRESIRGSIRNSVRAYEHAPWLACCHFFAEYLAPNDLQALACFNELVSGYWLGDEAAVIVRRPKVLSRDEQGRLHSSTGRCIEYRDGWGFYAWHGVRVPERVILAPETLTRQDWSEAENVEVRRVIQERMGGRFVRELGGVVRDTSPHGTLYEVALPGDPEHVARYVQVQDVSTLRQYLLRVPPTMQTAAEAVAWSFQMTVEEYGPAHEA